jgi:hypothetical protein
MDITQRPDGTSLSLWPEGCIVYAGVVIIANHKLFLEFNYISYHGVVLILLSILLYFAFLAFENFKFMNFESVIGIFAPIFSTPVTYFALFFMIIVNYMLDRISWYIDEMITQREEEQEKITQVQIDANTEESQEPLYPEN